MVKSWIRGRLVPVADIGGERQSESTSIMPDVPVIARSSGNTRDNLRGHKFLSPSYIKHSCVPTRPCVAELLRPRAA